ncbi:MAG: hypothetical protein WDN08_10570 [Rhizomicrobium sp.]
MMAARDAALVRAAAIREMVARNAAHFELAFAATDAARIARQASGSSISRSRIPIPWQAT